VALEINCIAAHADDLRDFLAATLLQSGLAGTRRRSVLGGARRALPPNIPPLVE
jgi:hypothetical protein